MKIIKYSVIAILIAVYFSSCQSVRLTKAGEFNMISHRNVDVKNNYVMLKPYAGVSEKELKKSTAETMQDAIDQTVKTVPGGEFLMNVKFYVVTHKKKKKTWLTYAAEGDVWGFAK